jgi:hypothetical protein
MVKKKILRTAATISAALLCSLMLAQEPVQNINSKFHPNLAKAQELVAEANHYIVIAQKDNRYDLHGHARKARQLLAEANDELKLAAEDANPGGK